MITITLILNVQSASKWIEFDSMGYPNYHKLDLSGGVNTNQRKYTAPDGTIIEASVDRWQNIDYYYLSNLFDGSLYHRTHGSTHHHSYWLGQCSTSETESFTITFDSAQDISHIVVSSKTLWADRYSWYAIDGYQDAAHANTNDVVEAVHITQMVNTDDDYYGKVNAHNVKGIYEVLKIYILKRGDYCAMNEIEIFVAN